MIKLTDILNEGVYDPGIFKAVFTAGGPGSGKSFTASTLFGMPEITPTVSGDGLKSVNSDAAFEKYLTNASLSHDVASLGKNDHAKAMVLRDKAKSATRTRMVNYINGKLGMIIDGTGKNYIKISTMVQSLRKEGYDCYMIFVNTSLEVALERNRKRSRKLPDEIVKTGWSAVQKNMGAFQSLFGSANILIVDNSTYKEFPKVVKKSAANFVRRPIKNATAKKWIAKELQLRKS